MTAKVQISDAGLAASLTPREPESLLRPATQPHPPIALRGTDAGRADGNTGAGRPPHLPGAASFVCFRLRAGPGPQLLVGS